MQGFHFIQGFHENGHTIEKVVYPLLYGLADVTLTNSHYGCRDYWCEWCSIALCGCNAVTWWPKSESCLVSEVFVRTKNVDSSIHTITFRTALYLIPCCG